MGVKRQRSFNDLLMTFVAVPLVVSWLVFACYVIYKGLNDDSGFIQENLDFYVALIAIIGGPALLFINSILGAWVQEQTAQMNALPIRLELDIENAKANTAWALEAQKMRQLHEEMLSAKEQDFLHKSGLTTGTDVMADVKVSKK